LIDMYAKYSHNRIKTEQCMTKKSHNRSIWWKSPYDPLTYVR